TLVCGALAAVWLQAADSPWDVRLPFKSATIFYEVSGMEKGSETLYIEEYGKKEAKYRKTTGKVMYQIMETDKIEVTTPDWLYDIDMIERTGTKITNPAKVYKQEYKKLTAKEKKTVTANAEKMGKNSMGGMEATVEKNAATLLGYPCDKTTVMGTTVYTIHDTGIALKTESKVMGMSSKSVALKLEKGKVPASVFALPKGVTITFDKEADTMMRTMAKNMIDTFKDPEAVKKMQQQQKAMRTQRQQKPSKADKTSAASDEPSQDEINEAIHEKMKALFGN
ncbi:MAG: hypothetical protein MUP09_07590, partial [Thiovulaceae bacterium]|nr:hypothetical protein [Sulfurimonadaceae bacterium]